MQQTFDVLCGSIRSNTTMSDKEEINLDSSLGALGVDSFSLLLILTDVAEKLDISLDGFADLTSIPQTVEELLDLLDKNTERRELC